MVDEAKSHTQVAQLTTAAVVAVVLLFLTKPLQYLPNAVLSAVVFLIGLKLIDIADMREIWRLRKDEFVGRRASPPLVVVVVGVEQGIILAIVLSLVLHVRRHYTPHDRRPRLGRRAAVSPDVPPPGTVSRARSRRLPLRGRALLSRTPSGSPRRFSGSSTCPARRGGSSSTAGDRRRRLHGRQDARGARRPAPAARSGVGHGRLRDSVRAGLDRYGVTAKVGETRFFATARAAVEAFRADRGPDPGQREAGQPSPLRIPDRSAHYVRGEPRSGQRA